MPLPATGIRVHDLQVSPLSFPVSESSPVRSVYRPCHAVAAQARFALPARLG